MHSNQGQLPRPRLRRWPRLSLDGKFWKAVFFISVLGNCCTTFLYLRASPARRATRNASGLEFEASPAVHAPPRALSSSSVGARVLSSSTSASGATSSSGKHHGPHQHDALLFLFNCVLLGAAVLHLTNFYPSMQVSITLFVLGMLYSLLLHGLKIKDDLGVFGESYSMWMDIDPHLLLFTMLPTLLAGDAMTIDTSVAKRVGKQCLYLAGPGVLISAMLTAVFLKFFLNWTFLTSLVTGSILCATDPVAVVALLKELGASPTLTVQIQGESLLNDGTAIVLYTLAYNSLSGEEYEVSDMAMFLVKTAIMAVGLGIFAGYFFFSWIRLASDRFNHSSSVIQILLTMCAAYWSFVFAEGMFKMSGVLATVACSLVLAHHMWPYIVDHQTMLDFWHVMENLGNIIIFVLGGALTGKAMVDIELIDYINLGVIYIFLLVLRGSFIFASRPLLALLHKDKEPLTVEDAMVMTWGGLRGAVGLALGIQVRRGRAANKDGVPQLDDDIANRILFFVAGIAFLTTCGNASTCPKLVAWLGITALPEAEAKVLDKFNQQLVYFSTTSENPAEVTDRLKDLLTGISHKLLSGKTTTPMTMKKASTIKGPDAERQNKMQSREELMDDLEHWVREFEHVPKDELQKIDRLPTGGLQGQLERMKGLLEKKQIDPEMAKAVNKAFLSMVNRSYWKQIQLGELRPGSDEADLLFTSIRFSSLKVDLKDFEFLAHLVDQKGHDRVSRISSKFVVNDVSASQTFANMVRAKRKLPSEEAPPTFIDEIVTSSQFNVACAIAILINVTYVAIEEMIRNPEDESSRVWVVFEGIFTMIFFVEFVLKFIHLKCEYFMTAWNCFDFSLVLLGFVGLTVSIITLDSSRNASGGSSESRVIRISRVLRTMRFLRLFRLFHAKLGADKYVSKEVAACMKAMQTLKCFVTAHMDSQERMLEYFTGEIDEVNEVEFARCLLQSYVQVHKAIVQAVKVHRQDPVLVEDVRKVLERKHIVEELERFVESALQDGAITSNNAGSLLHPLHHEVNLCISILNKRSDGVVLKQKQEPEKPKSTPETAVESDESVASKTDDDAKPSARSASGGEQGDAAAGDAAAGDAAAGVKPLDQFSVVPLGSDVAGVPVEATTRGVPVESTIADMPVETTIGALQVESTTESSLGSTARVASSPRPRPQNSDLGNEDEPDCEPLLAEQVGRSEQERCSLLQPVESSAHGKRAAKVKRRKVPKQGTAISNTNATALPNDLLAPAGFVEPASVNGTEDPEKDDFEDAFDTPAMPAPPQQADAHETF